VVISEFLKFNIDLNQAIAKIAKRENMNDDQIHRIVEEVNNQVYLIKYKKLVGADREVEFNIASIDGVKKCMRGESSSSDSDKTEPTDEPKKSEKVAFEQNKIDDEYMEKIASDEHYDLFNGNLDHSFGDLSVNMKYSRGDFFLKKIAETLDRKEDELNKISKEVMHYCNELGDTFISLEKLGSDVNEVMSAIVKSANLNEREIGLIKEATEERIAMYKERKALHDNFSVELNNIDVEKKASEKFTLGKYSLSKIASVVCDTEIPNILLSTNKSLRSIDDIVKLASDFKQCVNTLSEKNDEYIKIREKCASCGVTDEVLDPENFFQ